MLEELIPTPPLHFFEVSSPCHRFEDSWRKKHLLPSGAPLEGERSFASVYAAWEPEAVHFLVKCQTPLTEVHFPNIQAGDSFELWIDTRNDKSRTYPTLFCHHVYFLPLDIEEGIPQAGELTRFRGDEKRELADPSHLHLNVIKGRKEGYQMEIKIEKEALYGYEPEIFSSLGFTYRLNRFHGKPEHFSCSSSTLNIEQHPQFWGTLNLEGGGR